MVKSKRNESVDMVSALSIVFGKSLVTAISKALDSIGPKSERVTCGDIVEATATLEEDTGTRRVCLDKVLKLYPKLSVRKGRDGGIVHADEVREVKTPAAKAGKTLEAAFAALAASGVKLSPEAMRTAIAAAKASRQGAGERQ